MRAHFATIDTVYLTHLFLDERVSRLALHRLSTVSLDQFDGIPGQARIVHDAFAGILLQQLHAEQADQVVTLDKATVVIEQKATIEVAIPGNAEIGAMLLDRVDGRAASLGKQRIRNAVGEVAIGLVMNLDEFERGMCFQQIDDGSGHAVAGVDDDLEWFERIAVADITKQMIDVGR